MTISVLVTQNKVVHLNCHDLNTLFCSLCKVYIVHMYTLFCIDSQLEHFTTQKLPTMKYNWFIRINLGFEHEDFIGFFSHILMSGAWITSLTDVHMNLHDV